MNHTKAQQMLGISVGQGASLSLPEKYRNVNLETLSMDLFAGGSGANGGPGLGLSVLIPKTKNKTKGSSGAASFKSSSSSEKKKDGSNPSPSSKFRMKKAKSLFSGHRSKPKGSHEDSEVTEDLPSPTTKYIASTLDTMHLNHSKSQPSLNSPPSAGSIGQYRFPPLPSSSGLVSPESNEGHFTQHLNGHDSPNGRYTNGSDSLGASPTPQNMAHPYANSSATMRKTASHPTLDSAAGHGNRKPKSEEEDDDCPVCLESLSIRLQGEKPHVVPICGHRLHSECFETAYGVSPAMASREIGNIMGGVQRSGAGTKKGSIGICGVCRSDMKVSDHGETGKNKFAALSGQPGRSAASPPLDTHKVRSISKRTIGPGEESRIPTSLHDPNEDQDIVNPHQYLPAYMQHIALGGGQPGWNSQDLTLGGHPTIEPVITVRAEHQSIARSLDPEEKVHLTCMVTVEIPSRVPSTSQHQRLIVHDFAYTPSPGAPSSSINGDNHFNFPIPQAVASQVPINGASASMRRESSATHNTFGGATSVTEDFPTSPSISAVSTSTNSRHVPRTGFPGSLSMEHTGAGNTSSNGNSSSNVTPVTAPSSTFTTPSSVKSGGTFASIAEEPGKTHSNGGETYQPLNVATYSHINISATTLTNNNGRELDDAVTHDGTAAAKLEKDREAYGPFAAVFEDLQRRMADWKGHQPANFGSLRMWDTLQVRKDANVREFVVYLFEEALLCVVDDQKRAESGLEGASDRLRLKGRVFVKHMKQVEDTSSADSSLSLTILMEDDSLESFVIIFSSKQTLEVWRSQIQSLIDHHRPPVPQPKPTISQLPADSVSSRRDSAFSSGTSRSAQSSNSRFTKATTTSSLYGAMRDKYGSTSPGHAIPPLPTMNLAGFRRPSQVTETILNWQAPEPHTFVPLDLMLIISVPPPRATGPSSAALKLRLIKSTLDFVIHSVGPRSRISVVTYTVGDTQHGASLKKTPWLAVGHPMGMNRLEQVVRDIVGESEGRFFEDGLVSVHDPKEDKITVASAVNLALDIVLQRQAKSANSGILLLNEGKDGAQKQQIDLLMARLDAGGVPIHSIGWGKTHDPSSLWLLSNHTKGTYTFVRDFYQLKEAVAGCVGGLLSVAVGTLKLHISVQERRWFKIRKVAGVGSAIVGSDGLNVDIHLGELRFGEKKEMLVEVEMASPRHLRTRSSETHSSGLRRRSSMTATEDFFLKRIGMDPGSFTDSPEDFFEELEDGMADDVPIFDVRASFKDPLDDSSMTYKLPYPTLLTTTVMPPSKTGAESPSSCSPTVSDPAIVRRRMELLTSDMITRTLLLMSRRQDAQAQRLLTETTRIFGAIITNLIPPSVDENKISLETRYANEVLVACLQDIEHLRTGCENRLEFDQYSRNYGAQQAVALRDQRAWTDRTATEALFFCREWTAIFGKSLSTPSY